MKEGRNVRLLRGKERKVPMVHKLASPYLGRLVTRGSGVSGPGERH